MNTAPPPGHDPGAPLAVRPGAELLSDDGPAAARPRRRRRRLALPVAAGAAAVLLAGSAYAASTFLGGGGAQPEDVLPADAFALAKVDLDPSVGQKLAVYRLAKAFPKAEVRGQDDVRDDLLSQLVDGQDALDWDRDVKPWIGDRAGVAAVPATGGDVAGVVVALAHTDRAKAAAALRKAAAAQPASAPLVFAFSDRADYVLLGNDRDLVDRAAHPRTVLADRRTFRTGMDALDGDQIVTAWADLGAGWRALPRESRDAARKQGLVDVEPTGVVAVGAHASARYVEVEGRTVGVRIGKPSQVGTAPTAGTVQQLPTNTLAALSVTGLGDAAAQIYDQVGKSLGAGDLDSAAKEFGLALPGDLRTLLGEETLVALLDVDRAGVPRVGVRTRTSQPGAVALAHRTAERLGGGVVVRPVESGVAAGLDSRTVADVGGGGALGRTGAFREAVPDAGDAGLVLYADLAGLLRVAEQQGEDVADLRPLRAAGVTSRGGPDGSFRLRVTVR